MSNIIDDLSKIEIAYAAGLTLTCASIFMCKKYKLCTKGEIIKPMGIKKLIVGPNFVCPLQKYRLIKR